MIFFNSYVWKRLKDWSKVPCSIYRYSIFIETTKVKGRQYLCSCNFLITSDSEEKNGGRAYSLAGGLPQDWEGWRAGHPVCFNCWWQKQVQAWGCDFSCPSICVSFNLLDIWASPSSPWCSSEGPPQSAGCCPPGFTGWGGHWCSAGRSPSSPTPSLSATCFWEAPSDVSGEVRHPELLLSQPGWLHLSNSSPTIPTTTTCLLWRLQPCATLWNLQKVWIFMHWAFWLWLWSRPRRIWRRSGELSSLPLFEQRQAHRPQKNLAWTCPVTLICL